MKSNASVESKESKRDARLARRRLKEGGGLETLMMHAVLSESEELCQYLIAHGAEVNEMALTKAIEQSLESMVQLLMDRGAVVTTEMVESAKKMGPSEIVTLLEEHLHTTEA
jgi:hypothetical protein